MSQCATYVLEVCRVCNYGNNDVELQCVYFTRPETYDEGEFERFSHCRITLFLSLFYRVYADSVIT